MGSIVVCVRVKEDQVPLCALMRGRLGLRTCCRLCGRRTAVGLLVLMLLLLQCSEGRCLLGGRAGTGISLSLPLRHAACIPRSMRCLAGHSGTMGPGMSPGALAFAPPPVI